VFGEPTSAVERNGGCLLTWQALGLRLRFYTLLRERQCDSRSPFESAAISGPWETGRGLARGDSASRARTLYPRSAPLVHPFPFADPRHHALGLLVRTSPAIGDYGLAVEIRQGRARTLLLLNPQGGE
jgi:hypothetical protein